MGILFAPQQHFCAAMPQTRYYFNPRNPAFRQPDNLYTRAAPKTACEQEFTSMAETSSETKRARLERELYDSIKNLIIQAIQDGGSDSAIGIHSAMAQAMCATHICNHRSI